MRLPNRLVKAFDRLQLPLHIAAEVFGEDLQLSLLIQSGGLGFGAAAAVRAQPTPSGVAILEVPDFVLPATVTLIRSVTPGRFDPVIDCWCATSPPS